MREEGREWETMAPGEIPGTLALPSHARSLLKNAESLLEFGCGPEGGAAELALAEKGLYRGLDVNAPSIAAASRKFAGEPRAEFLCRDACLPPPDARKFAVILAKAFFTCLDRSAQHLAALRTARASAAKGTLLIVMDFLQDWNHPLYRVRYEEGARLGLEKGSFQAPPLPNSPGYVAHHFTREELENLARESGWKISHFETLPVRTRSGNRATGFFLIADAV
jgi:SAM-dependent methyltransferase